MDTIIDGLGREITVEANEDGTFTYSFAGWSYVPSTTDRVRADAMALEQVSWYSPD